MRYAETESDSVWRSGISACRSIWCNLKFTCQSCSKEMHGPFNQTPHHPRPGETWLKPVLNRMSIAELQNRAEKYTNAIEKKQTLAILRKIIGPAIDAGSSSMSWSDNAVPVKGTNGRSVCYSMAVQPLGWSSAGFISMSTTDLFVQAWKALIILKSSDYKKLAGPATLGQILNVSEPIDNIIWLIMW